MVKKAKNILSILLVCLLVLTMFSACAKKNGETNVPADGSGEEQPEQGEERSEEKPAGEPIVIKWGTHWVPEIDPNWRDEVTGEPGMSPENLRASEIAYQKVLDELNVKIEFVQYPSDVREILLQSVLAGDPFADLVILWNGSQGTILGQGILQPLDDYIDMFLNDEDTKWMVVGKTFGHYYLLNRVLDFLHQWPLVFNIKYIEAVDSLKENGKTVYPTDLFKRGEWTWSKFEEYLSKIKAYYEGKPSPVRPEIPIKAFQTDYRFTVIQALHSNGVALFGENGLEVDTPEAKQAVAYVDNLMKKGLMMSVRYSDDSPVPGWTWQANDFANGETVFTNMVPWLSANAANTLASRGESMGIVPFPRPDHLAPDDPRYRQAAHSKDSVAILRGIPEDRVELALKVYKLYFQTFYKELAGSDKAMDYINNKAESVALAQGFDVLHEKIGKDILDMFLYISRTPVNEFGESLGLIAPWGENIVGNSIYGLNNTPKYDVAIDARKNELLEYLSAIEKALQSDKPTDNIAPKFTKIDANIPIAFPAGTDPSKIDWSTIYKAVDNVDGDLDMSKAEIDISAIDFNKVGKYAGGFKAKIKDASGNEGSVSADVIIYDPNNKEKPTLVIKSEYRKIAKDEDPAKINWANDFVETAVDKDGFDIKFNVKADISQLDTTTPGKYPVEITVTDFVGNEAKATIEVTVE